MIKEDFEKAITPKTRAILLNSPCNPTGVVYTKEELVEISEVAEKYNLEIISDEIYEKLVFDGEKHYSIASLSPYAKEHTIVVNGVSKTYAMTGWSLGYLCAPAPLSAQMLKLHQYAIMCAPTTAQFAAVEALMNGDADVEEMVAEYDRRRRTDRYLDTFC